MRLKERLRAVLAGDVTRDQAAVLLERWCARA
jgi:hypothetical protein